MTFKLERVAVLKRFLALELRATRVMLVRAVPSLVIWAGILLWFFKFFG
jgi:hypothetical protein